MRSAERLASTPMLLLLGACAAAPPPDVDFDAVKSQISERIGMCAQWNLTEESEREVASAVHELLAQEITSDAAVQIALLKNARLQAIYEDLGIAEADLVQAGLLQNPVFETEARFPGQALEVHVIQDFLDVLLLPMRTRVAEARLEAVRLNVTHEVLRVAAEAKKAFVEVQASTQMVEMRRSIAAAAAASVEAARRIHDAGNSRDLEFESEQALDGQARIDLSMAEEDLNDHREQLTELMNLFGEDTTWTIGGRLPDVPATEIPPQGLESLAVSRRLDLLAARQEVEAKTRSLGLTRVTAVLPGLNLGLHSEREPDGLNTVGPSLDLPLAVFDHGQGTITRADAELRRSVREYTALAIEIRSRVRAARDRMFAARSRAEYVHAILLPLRARIVSHTQLEYNGMLLGVFQLLEAKQGEIDAGRQYVEALRDYWVARSDLERETGGRLDSAALETQAVQPESKPTPPKTEPSPAPHHEHSMDRSGGTS